MNINEYQAKNVLKEYGLRILDGYLIEDPKESKIQAGKIKTDFFVVKAQICAGGRGKAGGIRTAKSVPEAVKMVRELIGKRLITKQTGQKGTLVRKVYIEEGCSIKHEFYLSLVLDLTNSAITIITSPEGGMDIEEAAEKYPEKIFKLKVDPFIGLTDYQIRTIGYKLDISKDSYNDLKTTLQGLYKCFMEKDCTMIEINPLVLTEDGKIVALDAKMSFDENALFRHPDILILKDTTGEDPRELEAAKYDTIGCLVNGAGLAMATMDSIKNAGGSPANFLDVGGSASIESITNAFKLILTDSRIKGIFVNIFGGIMECNKIAHGIIQATQTINFNLPVVVRLEGTNQTEGKVILAASDLDFYTADSMDEGAQLIVNLVAERSSK